MSCCRIKLLLWRMLQLMPIVMMMTLMMVETVISQAETTTTARAPGSPYISEGPTNKSMYAGARVNLPCTAQAYPQQVQHTWFKDDQDLRATNAYTSNRITIDSDGQLVIQVLTKQDRGWYKCRVTNSMGFDEASAYINVVYPPVVGNIPTEVTWAKDYNGQLDCPADANPPLTSVKWQRDQDVLESSGRYDILQNGTLLVSRVQYSDAGHYQCTPINNISAGAASKRIHVQVKDPPYFVSSPEVRYIRNVGENVRMACEARGLPSVTIQWIKVGGYLDRMSDRVTITNSYLEIRNLTKGDHGRYECRAINNIATVVKVTDLRIDRTTPHAPFNVTVTPGTFNVTVTWEPAHDGGNTQQYTLWFRRRNQIVWNHMKVSPPGATHNRLYNLQADTEYEFRVVSTNSYGNSSFSDTVTQRTLARGETLPHRKITTPSATSPSSSSLQLRPGYDPDTVNSLPTYANGTPYYPVVKQNLGIPPTPPLNLTARVRDERIELRWDLPVRSPVRFFTFQIEYLRNTRWVRLEGIIEGETTRGAVINNMGYGSHSLRLVACGTLACSGGSNIVTVTISDDDLVLPEALVGGIVGGILFLLVAILLALLAIFHSRKKDRKSKAKKYNDVTYGKPDEMNGRFHQRSTSQRDRWTEQYGGGDVVTSLSNTDSIFFTPKSRDLHHHQHLEQLQKQQLQQKQHHHHHHHQQQHHENPHFFHYSQHERQQRPKFVVSHGGSDVTSGGDGGAAGGSRNRKPPDKTFDLGQGDQHRPYGLVPFTQERRSKKKKSKKKKKKEREDQSPGVGREDQSPGVGRDLVETYRPTDKHETSFHSSDLSQAGSFISRPPTLRDGDRNHNSWARAQNLPPGVISRSQLSGHRDELGRQYSSQLPRDGGQRSDMGYRLENVQGNSHISNTGEIGLPPGGQYNNNSFSDSREEGSVRPLQHVSTLSLPSHPHHHHHSLPSNSQPHVSKLSLRDSAPGINPSHVTPSHVTPSHMSPSHVTASHVTPSHVSMSATIPSHKGGQSEHSGEGRDVRDELQDDTEDNVFWNVQPQVRAQQNHPGLPRHSSLKPGHKMTYLTDDEPGPSSGLFGLQDISSVLEPVSEQPSQIGSSGNTTFSPSYHNNSKQDDNNTTVKPLAMVTPSHKSPGDHSNTSTMSSGRPLGYTRDRLQGVLQQLRENPHPGRSRSEARPQVRTPQDLQPRSRSEGGGLHVPDYSTQSDPFPESRYIGNPRLPHTQSTSGIGPYSSRDTMGQHRPPRYGDPTQRDITLISDTHTEKNPYVNLASISRDDRERGEPSLHGHFPRSGDEENPYRNLPQPRLRQDFDEGRRPRALSEGSRMFRERTGTEGDEEMDGGFVNKGASYPDVSLPRQVRGTEGRSNQVLRQWYPNHSSVDQHRGGQSNLSMQRHSSGVEPRPLGLDHHRPDRYASSQVPIQYPNTSMQPALGCQSSTSSGIGSRNTSQSTSSLQHNSQPFLGGNRPGFRGRGRGGTSFSSGHTEDGDISLDTSSGGYRGEHTGNPHTMNQPAYRSGFPRHRRDTSVDENYEFDSINALENDIMDDLRRYSRLAGGGSGSGATTLPANQAATNLQNLPRHQQAPLSAVGHEVAMYPAADTFQQISNRNHRGQPQPILDHPDHTEQRFERLREEFKAYRSLKGQGQSLYGGPGSEDGSLDGLIHPPTAGAALPIGLDGEPLYPMDSEML